MEVKTEIYHSYSVSFKRKVVLEYQELGLRGIDISKKYGVAESTLRGWFSKYGEPSKKTKIRQYGGHITMKDETDKKVSELESKLSDALLKIEVYDKMCELAKELYAIDLKKNYYAQALEQLGIPKKQ
jgi:transposase-like protein